MPNFERLSEIDRGVRNQKDEDSDTGVEMEEAAEEMAMDGSKEEQKEERNRGLSKV